MRVCMYSRDFDVLHLIDPSQASEVMAHQGNLIPEPAWTIHACMQLIPKAVMLFCQRSVLRLLSPGGSCCPEQNSCVYVCVPTSLKRLCLITAALCITDQSTAPLMCPWGPCRHPPQILFFYCLDFQKRATLKGNSWCPQGKTMH